MVAVNPLLLSLKPAGVPQLNKKMKLQELEEDLISAPGLKKLAFQEKVRFGCEAHEI